MPRASPTPSTEPTRMWVVDTGMPEARGQHDRRRGRELGREGAARRELGDLLADGLDHPVAPASRGRSRCRCRRPSASTARRAPCASRSRRLRHVDDRRQRADRVGDVVRAVREGDRAGGHDDRAPTKTRSTSRKRLRPGSARPATRCTREAAPDDGDPATPSAAAQPGTPEIEVEADVLQALEHRDEPDDEEHDEDEEGAPPASRPSIGSSRSRTVRRTRWKITKASTPPISGDVTHEATICATLPQLTASTPSATAPKPTIAPTIEWVVETGSPMRVAHQQQRRGRGQRRQHAVEQQLRVRRELAGVEHALADGVGDVAAREEGARELEHAPRR